MKVTALTAAMILACSTPAAGTGFYITDVTNVGDGMFGYTFTAVASDAMEAPFGVNLTFEATPGGQLHQTKAVLIPGVLEYDVNTEGDADLYNGLGTPPYDKDADSWWGDAFYKDGDIADESWGDNSMHLESTTEAQFGGGEPVKLAYVVFFGEPGIDGCISRLGAWYCFERLLIPEWWHYVEAEANGPYQIGPGEVVTLDAGDSWANAPILRWDWELDGDGQYDDASGETVELGYDYLVDDLGLALGTHVIEVEVSTGGVPGWDTAVLEIIPEPGAAALLFLGAIALIRRRRPQG
jgi:hypothetical protein